MPLLVAAAAGAEDPGHAVHQFEMGGNGRGIAVSSFLFG